jgi:capsular exopolysaccharide synthesis family protein
VAAIKRFWWLVAGLTAIGGAAGVFLAKHVQPTYEAHAAMWISDLGQNNNSAGAFKEPELLPPGSWIELFRSFAIVDRVIAQQHLWFTPKVLSDSVILDGLMPMGQTATGDYTLLIDSTGIRYTLSELKHGVVERGVVGDSIGRAVGFLWAPTAATFRGHRSVGFWVAQPRPIATALNAQVEVVMQERSNFLKLTLTGSDKWRTAAILNTWMQAFVDKVADLRRSSLSDVARILDTQRSRSQQGLRNAETALERFRQDAITRPGEGTSISAATTGGSPSDVLAMEYFKTETDYENAKHDREALESVATRSREGAVSPDEITSIPAVAAIPSLVAAAKDLLDKEDSLRKLHQLYTDEYQPVKQISAAVQTLRTQTIPKLATNAAQIVGQRERDLQNKLRKDSLKLRDIPIRSIEEARLRRDLSVAENLNTTIENRYETTRLSATSTVPDVNILDHALPASTPQQTKILMLMVGGFGGSFALGIALALLLDLLDPRFRYPEQITHELKLEVIGAIPAVPKPGDASADPEAMLQSIEAFRGLRMNLHHAFNAPPVLVTVTSPGAGDGKSMISSNLALSFSEAGYRTMLIDGDIRRGKVHSIFDVDRRPGLLDYLAGDAESHEIIREAPVHGRLTIIPSGTRRHRGPELLTSARLPELLNMLRPRFDVIIIDSAPLAAGIDAYALGVATGNMILIMRTGVTDRRVAKAKLKLLERLPVRMIGAVVNSVPAAGLYSEYSYLHGYTPDVDSEAGPIDEIPVLRPAETNGE